MAAIEIRVPDLGDFKDVAVIDVLVAPGETVQVDAPLLTLETEKATMDVPATAAGIIEQLHVSKGSRVSAGTLIATLRSADVVTAPLPKAPPAPSAAVAQPAAQPGPVATAPENAAVAPAAVQPRPAPVDDGGEIPPGAVVPAALPPVSEDGMARAHASPSVRKFARELGADLGRIQGSGQKGRITEQDVKAYVKSALSGTPLPGAGAAEAGGRALPQVVLPDFAQFGAIEIRPLSRVQRISGPRLHASWVNLPHVTQFDDADVTALEEMRKSLKSAAEVAGVKLTALAFIVRACVKALQQFPAFNSSLDERGENLILKKYFHIGFAADTPHGLMVPVIRDANRKDIYEIARELGSLSQKARAGKLAAGEMQGGTFSISNLGSLGGTGFTPIINAPEVAILGVARTTTRPVFRDGTFVPRLMVPLALSYDHRVIDGVAGARFMGFLVEALADAHGLIEAVP